MVVVGAGPAGAAAALAIRHRRPDSSVSLLDRSDFPRDKVCGDGIAPHVFDALSGVGVSAAGLTGGFPVATGLRLTSPAGVSAERSFVRPAQVIPRRIFDDRLCAAAVSAGATLLRHTARAVTRERASVTVDGLFRARVLIGADGAESVVRRVLLDRTRRSWWGAGRAGAPTAIALRGYALDPYGDGIQRIVMSARSWPAYAWSFPIGNGTVNVGYGELLRPRTQRKRGPGSLPTRSELAIRMRALLPEIEDPMSGLRGHRLPLSPGRPAIADGRILLVGDARSLINPLTGEGIYYAVRSGILAGQSAAGSLDDHSVDAGRRYRSASGRELDRHFRHTSWLTKGMRWPSLLEAGVRAAAGHQGVFDDLVELGLGAGLITARLARGVLRAGVHS